MAKKKAGLVGRKKCPKCNKIVGARTKTCPKCGQEFIPKTGGGGGVRTTGSWDKQLNKLVGAMEARKEKIASEILSLESERTTIDLKLGKLGSL